VGKIHEITITHLEMFEDPRLNTQAPSHSQIALIRADNPPVHFYRYLYKTVGADYIWVNRLKMNDEELTEAIQDPAVELYVLYVNGCPAGYVELDFRKMPDVELVFMGLMPEVIGQGFGRYLLSQAISLAWLHSPKRLFVQTCTLDHPRALGLYQRCGFVPFAQEQGKLEEPEG